VLRLEVRNVTWSAPRQGHRGRMRKAVIEIGTGRARGAGMNRTPPAISAALRERGFHAIARDLDRAADAPAEIAALRLALATIDGAQHVLRCYARSLRNTQAVAERVALRVLEERVVEHLGTLLRRASATMAVARNVQEVGS
jgi:hypothetical protein